MADRISAHIPVLATEVSHWLSPNPGDLFVDGTFGAGGHTRLLSEEVGSTGLIIALDRDPEALAASEQSWADKSVSLVEANFCDLPEVLRGMNIERVDGVLLDLGLSSDQLADAERGFSYNSEGPLDLRFNPQAGEPAWKLVNRLSAEHLADIIFRYGEERYSRRIARKIVEHRRKSPIHTAAQLADLVRSCVPRARGHSIDPATRTFQALRIAINDEIKSLEIALRRIPDCLRVGARLAIISFHSLEDRPVKHAMRDDPRLKVLTKKPIRPTEDEIRKNPRSRSARLRVAQRIDVETT